MIDKKNQNTIVRRESSSLLNIKSSIDIVNKILSKEGVFNINAKTIFSIEGTKKKDICVFCHSQFILEREVIICVSDEIQIFNSKQQCIYRESIDSESTIHPVIWKNNLLIFHKDGLVTYLDLKNGTKCSKLIHHSYFLTRVSVSTDEKYLITGYITGHVILWDPYTLSIIKSIATNCGGINNIKFNQNQLILSGYQNQIVVLEPASNNVTKHIKEGDDLIFCLDYNVFNNLLASASTSNILRIYDFNSYQCLFKRNFNEIIVHMSFSENGKYLGIVFFSGICMVFETTSFSLISKYEEQKTEEYQQSVSRGIIFDKDCNVITCSSVDGSINKWK
jgi:WD40 repeat protein